MRRLSKMGVGYIRRVTFQKYIFENVDSDQFMIFYYFQTSGFPDLNFWPPFLSFDILFVSLKCVFCVF